MDMGRVGCSLVWSLITVWGTVDKYKDLVLGFSCTCGLCGTDAVHVSQIANIKFREMHQACRQASLLAQQKLWHFKLSKTPISWRLFPRYGYGGRIDDLYYEEIGSRMGPGEHYMDYTGSSLYTNSQLAAVFTELRQHVFGNPHSANPSSLLTEEKVRLQSRYLRPSNICGESGQPFLNGLIKGRNFL